MLARRGSAILAFNRRDAVRLIFISTLLVAGLTFILAFEDVSTMTLIADLFVLGGWLLLSIVIVSTLVAWLWRFRSRLWHRNNIILLVGLTLLGTTVLLALTGDRTVAPYLVPTAAAALLLAVLVDAGLATVVLAMIAVFLFAYRGHRRRPGDVARGLHVPGGARGHHRHRPG